MTEPKFVQLLNNSSSMSLWGVQPWYAEAHQFRLDTEGGIGRPTPEGAHRDGVDLVAVFLVARHGIKGGETRVFQASGPAGKRFTMTAPWTLLLIDDARVIHESTPIQPDGETGHREVAGPGEHEHVVVAVDRLDPELREHSAVPLHESIERIHPRDRKSVV